MTFTLPLSAKPSANSTLCTKCNEWKLDTDEMDADHVICTECAPEICESCWEGDAELEIMGRNVCTDCTLGDDPRCDR